MKQSLPTRRGLTLLEVVVSMAIFLMAVVAIWQLVAFGTERAIDVKLQAETSLRCQSKLAEVMIGAQPFTSSGGFQPDEEPFQHLEWKMEATDGPGAGLKEVKVWVKAKAPSGREIESMLSQIVLEPTLHGSTQDRPPPPPQSTPTEDAPTTPEANPTTPTTPTTPAPTTPTIPNVPMNGKK
jgi:general secretion pathway protein I